MKRKFLIWFLCLSVILVVSVSTLTSCIIGPEELEISAVEYSTVSIDLNDGSTPTTRQVKKGQKLTGVSEPTREGYEFIGWKANDVVWTMEETITANITIVAQWTIIPVVEYSTVTIDLNDGSTPTTKQVVKGEKLTGVSSPTREGHTFAGWKANDVVWTMETAITADITIVAQWTENEPVKEYFTVTIDLNDGSTPTTKQVVKGEKLTGVSAPTRKGYTFAGWKANDVVWTMETAITADITIVAQWTENEPVKEYFTVTIDLNDGSTPTTKQVVKGEKLTGVSAPTREGYTFAGWKANDVVWTMDTAITANITIVAQWIAVPHATLVFGNGQKEEILYAVKKDDGFIYEAPITPKNDNKLFTGWYLDDEYNASYHFDKEAENGIILYAKWSLWEEMFSNTLDSDQIKDLFADIDDYSYELGSEENEKLFAEILSGEKDYRNYLDWFANNLEYILRFNEESWKCAKLILEKGKFTEELREKYFGFYQLTATSPYFVTSGKKSSKSIYIYFNEDWKIKYFEVYDSGFDSNEEIIQEVSTYEPIYLVNGELKSYYLSFDSLSIDVIYNNQKINCSVSASYEIKPIEAIVYNGEIQKHETIIYQTNCKIISNFNNVYPQNFDDILLFTSSQGVWDLETVWDNFRDEALTFSNSLYPGKNKAKIRYFKMSENN